MRLALASALSVMATATAVEGVTGQTPGCACNPDALGVARVVNIDTTGPGFEFEQYKPHDFLLIELVVLTFDDRSWPTSTRAALEALQEQSEFFPVGNTLWHPVILKQVAQNGHTIGSQPVVARGQLRPSCAPSLAARSSRVTWNGNLHYEAMRGKNNCPSRST
jgi:hypothetical protein